MPHLSNQDRAMIIGQLQRGASAREVAIAFNVNRRTVNRLKSNLTGRRYVEDILRPHVISYAGAIGSDFNLVDDNARPHRAGVVDDVLNAVSIERMNWHAKSPDLNPIENV